MRPASAGSATGRQSRLQIKTGNRGLCRRTEPRDADIQMQGFLESGTVPVLSFKASPQKVQASLVRPLQAVRTDLMSIATAILDRVAGEWGCIEELVQETRGDKIDRRQAEEFIEDYLKHHNVPGKLQIRWVNKLNSGGKLQEYGRRDKPTARQLRLWINSGFAGVQFSRSMVAFADHEICTHAVRAINDHAQVWVNQRGRYGLCSGGRERLSTEEGLAALNSLQCYPSQTRHMWSAAMLYYCAVKGNDMGFGELHKHIIKYVRCPAKRYWYCVRTKGKRADLDQPGACGKGQVYLEGAVDILRAVDDVDFHLLYSGRVPLSKLDRVKNIARPSLVTLPKFVQDQGKYKAILRQIGILNGILLPDKLNLGVGLKQSIQPRVKSLSPTKRRARPAVASTAKQAAASPRHQKQVLMGSSKRKSQPRKQDAPSPLPPSTAACGSGTRDAPVKRLSNPPPPAAPPPTRAVVRETWRGITQFCEAASTRNMVQGSPHEAPVGKGPAVIRRVKTIEVTDFSGDTDGHGGGKAPDQGVRCSPVQGKYHFRGGRAFENEPLRSATCTRNKLSFAGASRRLCVDRSLNASKPFFDRKLLSSSASTSRPSSAISFTALGRRVSGGSLSIGTHGWPLADGEECSHGSGEGCAVEKSSASLLPHLGSRT